MTIRPIPYLVILTFFFMSAYTSHRFRHIEILNRIYLE